MQKPFQAAANAFGERIKDETTDIQAAGGLFAVSQRKGLGLFPDFTSAMREQQKINYRLAQSAAALPGSTEEYVRQGKLLTDTMIQVLAKNKEGTVKFSKTIGGDGTVKDALGVIVQKFTEKAVLLGQGTQSRSIYGIPQLTERLVNAPNVTETMFNRYAAFINNPLVANIFREMAPKIAKTAAGSAERLQLAYELLDKSLPNEVIQAYKSSVAGTFENLRSLLFSPEVGIFGLGRKFKNIAPQVDQYGRYIDEQGKVVNQMSQAAKADLGIFDLLKDIIVGFGNPIAELISILPQVFDPLKAIGLDFVELRNVAQAFYRNFHEYSAYFRNLGKELGSFNISSTSGARGALAAINNLLRGLGVINIGEFKATAAQLKDRFADLPKIGYELVGKIMNSPFMKMVGEVVGKVIGDTLSMVAKLLGGATDLATAGPFAQGLKAGFDAAKGSAAVTTIFQKLMDLFIKGIIEIFKAAPLQTSILAGLVLLGPAIAAAIGTAIVGAIPRLLAGGALLSASGGGAAAGGAAASRSSSLVNLFGAPKAVSLAMKGREFVGEIGQVSRAFLPIVKTPAAISNIVKFGNFAKALIPGKIPVIGAGLDVGARMLQGQGAAQAVGGGVANLSGSVIGGAIGTFIAPGVGTAIGSVAGSIIGGMLYDTIIGAFSGPSDAMREAARAQKFAADYAAATRKGIPTVTGKEVGPAAEYAGSGFAGISQITRAFKYAGLEGDKSSQVYLTAATNMANLRAEYQKLNDEAAAQKAAAGGRVNTELQAKLDASRATLAAAEASTAAAWNKITATNKTKISNAIVQMQTSATAFNEALKTQAAGIALAMQQATAQINAAKLTPGGVKDLSKLLPDDRGKTPQIVPIRAYGSANPRSASSLEGAIAFENAHKPSGSSLVIANSSETIIPAAAMGYFPSASLIGDRTSNRSQQTSVNAPITIYQQPGQSPKELAAMVAMEISNAVADVRNSSYYV
jgi:hypothetical protein